MDDTDILYRGIVEHNETVYFRGYPFIGGKGGALVELRATPLDFRVPQELAMTPKINKVFAELAKLREENQRLREELHKALGGVLVYCSCDGDYDCDRCKKTRERRVELKQLEGEK